MEKGIFLFPPTYGESKASTACVTRIAEIDVCQSRANFGAVGLETGLKKVLKGTILRY